MHEIEIFPIELSTIEFTIPHLNKGNQFILFLLLRKKKKQKNIDKEKENEKEKNKN